MKPTLHFGAEVDRADVFCQRYMRAAAALHALGIGAGDVVALLLRNEPLLLEIALAARWLGARWCPLNWHSSADEVQHVLDDSAAKLLIGHADLLQRLQQALPSHLPVYAAQPREATRAAFGLERCATPQAAWEDVRDAAGAPVEAHAAAGGPMFYSSGTTGRAKGVKRDPATPEQTAAWLDSCRIAYGVEPGMRALVSAPLYHAAPGSYAVLCALHDADIWIEPRFDAEATLRLIEAERISHLYLVPTMFVRLLRLPPELRARHDLRSVRFVACTGSPCAPEVKRQMIGWWGPVIHEAYAATELGLITHIDSAEALKKPGSAGRALPGAIVRVLDASGRELPPGKVGLIYARHSAVTDFSYTGDPSARRKLERDGLWTLGDMGYLDDDGYLYIVDRQADLVISGGVNIYPAEIEKLLLALPGVADCAVFGIPDDEYGEALAAAVQPEPAAALSAARVQAWLRERIAGYKVPRLVTFHERLPREETGKIYKRQLREPYWAASGRRI
jgi:long-chain acyl-CoA synthetase